MIASPRNCWNILGLYALSFLDVIRPPEMLQFMDYVIPVLHGERTFTHHHYCHGYVIVGTIYICVPKTVTKIEIVTAFALVLVITYLCRAFHIQDRGLTFVFLNQKIQYSLTIAFTP